MKFSRLLALLAGGLVLTALTSAGALAQTAPQGGNPAVKSRHLGLKITLRAQVKDLKAMGGYYLKGTTEVYQIANKNPEILGPLAKSGETVTIEARAMGDLLTIETINGKKYSTTSPPAPK